MSNAAFRKLREQQRIRNNLNQIKGGGEKVKAIKSNVSASDLNDIKGVGESTVIYLYEIGIKTKSQLLTKTEKEIGELIDNPLTRKHILNFLRQNKQVGADLEQ